MNSETFAQFLKTPAYLYRISYQELKSLVVQYPYCQNLRYLLLKKSQADQHIEYERNLQMAATYSANRSFLYEQLYSNQNIPANRESNVAIEEEQLELRELETLDLEPQKEVLFAELKEESNLEINAVPPIAPSLDLPDMDALEVLEEGNIDSDELPDDMDSSIEDLFAEEEADENEDELLLPELVDTEEKGHQISEVTASEEEKGLISPEIVSNAVIDNLDITHEIEEEDIPEVLPEASSDELEDLFAEDTEIIDLVPIQDNSSIGLDVDPLPEEEILPDTEETVEDFMADITTITGAASIASIVTHLNEEEEKIIEEEKPAPIIELEVEKVELSDSTIDITDLSPVSQSDNEEEDDDDEFEIETELISPQSSFSNWLKQFNSPQISVEIEDLDEKSQKKKKVNYTYELVNGEWKQLKIKTKVKKKKKKSKAELIAAESVKLSKDVVTETLAQLLEKQEHYAKAIKMYERLRLENPEKSDYFASKIETLQLKL